MLLSAEHIFKNYGIKQLFDDVSLYLNEKEKIGILGVNGTGKSTLLKILANLESPDQGLISLSPNITMSYLPQNPTMNADFTVLQQVFEGFSAEFRQLNEYKANSMLNKLSILDRTAKVGTLSVGQRKRVSLVATLIKPADILILDEPTNHLDSEMVCWLEQYLNRFNGGLIMVTHDRYFLERVVNNITELANCKLYSYEANYSKYLELKAQRGEMNKASERKRQSILRKEYQWIIRGARARSTKSRGRIQRYEELKDQTAELENDNVQMSSLASRLGRKIIEINKVCKKFDNRNVIDDFSYMISRDDRVGIVGRNGAGKSTLLNIIAGRMLPDSGSVDMGITVNIGYFMQECCEMDFNQRVFDYISNIAGEIKTDDGTFTATQMLERFLFTSDQQFTVIGRLSGGERRRLYLLSVLMTAPNILLLDEPTNDLDIETLTILEDYLETFPGAVIAVSHDRYFLDKIATSIFEVDYNGKITNYTGNYSDYADKRLDTEALGEKDKTQTKENDTVAKNKTSQLPKKLKFTFKEQKEFETIDQDINAVETRIAQCLAEIQNSASDYIRLQELSSEKELLDAQLDGKTERWVYLNELNDKINSQ